MMLFVITEIIYHFLDASVPPPYHRSFTLTVTQSEVRVVVDSYGEVLADQTYPLEEGVFHELVDFLTESDIRPADLVSPEGTGGTTETLKVYAGSEELMSGWIYRCAGEEFGTLTGEDLEELATRLRALVPDLPELLRT